MMMKEIKVAIVGFGGIARAHYAAYRTLMEEGMPVRVVAVCDKNREGCFQPIKINLDCAQIPLAPDTHIYDTVEELIEQEDFDMADVCLPTFLHAEVSIKLLRAGKHVLCEKPMALSGELCDTVIEVARECGKWFRVAQSMRYHPFYLYLRDCIHDGRFGILGYLKLKRICRYPSWAADFKSLDKTGGMLLDTGIHDVDITRFMLGNPICVRAVVYRNIPLCQLAESRLFYPNLTVCIETAWDDSRKREFNQGYRAYFEQAALIYKNDTLTLTRIGAEPVTIKVEAADVFVREIRAFIEDIVSDSIPFDEDSVESVRIIEALKESSQLMGSDAVIVDGGK